jgi:uncharacterized protein (DUF362 family)
MRFFLTGRHPKLPAPAAMKTNSPRRRSSASFASFLCLAMSLALATAAPVRGAEGFVPRDAANSPLGTAIGARPGRVAWSFDPRATTWDGRTNSPGWWSDTNTHPKIVGEMVSAVVRSVGDASSDRAAWQRLFVDHNRRHGRGEVGYKPGEKIAIKVNLNQCRSHGDNGNASYIAPQLVFALLRELTKAAGVPAADIFVFDTSREVPSTIFDAGTRQFPGVHFVDSTGTDGREKSTADPAHPLYLQGSTTTLYFPACLTGATYLINVAGLKGHTLAGMTVCGKNHLGTVLYDNGGVAARELHRFISVRGGRGGPVQQPGDYNGLVDLDGHRETGGKTLLYVIDALYATKHNEYRLDPSCKWQSAPFNGNWTASIFASQDGVAIDSVALDFLCSEPTLRDIVVGNVDNYLHEAALAGSAGSKIAYDPEKDGSTLTSQGVHEHWNNAVEKRYSRNLGSGAGIELVQLPAAPATPRPAE